MVFESLFQFLLAMQIQVKGTNTHLLKIHLEQDSVLTVGGIKINTISIPCPQGVYNLEEIQLSLSFLILKMHIIIDFLHLAIRKIK